MKNKTVVEKLASHVARLNGLDAERSKRIYRVLNDLSVKSVNALKNNEMNIFSFHTDRMRPLLSYITNNTVKISSHLINEKVEQKVSEEILNKELQRKRDLAMTLMLRELMMSQLKQTMCS